MQWATDKMGETIGFWEICYISGVELGAVVRNDNLWDSLLGEDTF